MNEGVHYQQRDKKGHFKKLNPVHKKHKERIEAYMKGASPLPPDFAVRMVARDVRFLSERKKKHELSMVDSLTGLKNRRFVFGDESKPNPSGELRRLFLGAKRERKPLAVIMLDIDHFKNVNDKYSHDAGDIVLKQLAKVLNKVIRESDITARIGGEEFFLILQNTDLTGAVKLAEIIREAVEKKDLNPEGNGKMPKGVTISLGISTYSKESKKIKSEADLFNTADKALHQAKESGRNQTWVVEENTLGNGQTIFHSHKALAEGKNIKRISQVLRRLR